MGEATVQQRMDGGALKLSTFMPLQIRKRGVRKVVIRPDGESAGSTTRDQFDNPMLVALARAFYWQQLLDGGVVVSGTGIAQREGLHHSTKRPRQVPVNTDLEAATTRRANREKRLGWPGNGPYWRIGARSHPQGERPEPRATRGFAQRKRAWRLSRPL
jgi:hypothetical protein